MQLFAKVADEVPEGANLSTWGSISKGGIHGINRFGKDFWIYLEWNQVAYYEGN